MPDEHTQSKGHPVAWFKRAPAIVTIARVLLAGGSAAAVLQATKGGPDTPQQSEPPTTEDPEPEPEPELSDEESALLAKLPNATDCVSAAEDPPAAALASLDCNVDGSPATYTSFATASDMRAYYDSGSIEVTPGDCEGSWNEEGVWDLGGEVKGRFKCYDYGEGSSAIEWMENERLIHAFLFSDFGAHEGLLRVWQRVG